jgi:hypothetical protein
VMDCEMQYIGSMRVAVRAAAAIAAGSRASEAVPG